MPYYIECGNCSHWKGKTTEYHGTILHYHSGVCMEERSEKYNTKMYDTEYCDCFELREENSDS